MSLNNLVKQEYHETYAKCTGSTATETCNKRSTCFRFTKAPHPKHQPWILLEVAVKDGLNNCKFYCPLEI